jgi:tetratricopeptide (TPR) repeat protein
MVMNESIKAALIALDLKEGVTMTEIRAQYLDKTSQQKFRGVIESDEQLKKEFVKYHNAYITLTRHYAESDSAAELEFYPPDQVFRIHLNQGIYHLLNQNYLKAGEKFQAAHKIDALDKTALLYLGILLLKRKNYYAAEKYFKDVVKSERGDDDGWFYLGECYMKAGEHRKAKPMYETARNLNPSRIEIASRLKEINEALGIKPVRKQSFLRNVIERIIGKR